MRRLNFLKDTKITTSAKILQLVIKLFDSGQFVRPFWSLWLKIILVKYTEYVFDLVNSTVHKPGILARRWSSYTHKSASVKRLTTHALVLYLKLPLISTQSNLIFKTLRLKHLYTRLFAYLDINNISLLVDAHIRGQRNWACGVKAVLL